MFPGPVNTPLPGQRNMGMARGGRKGRALRWRAMPEPPPTVGRNDPCPCGSGKRYKHCHGAPGALPSPDALVAPGRRGPRPRRPGRSAERRYRAALAAGTRAPAALHYLGVVLYQRKRLDEALPLLDRAAALVPGEPEFHNNRGLALAAAMRDHRGDRRVPARARAQARPCGRLEQPGPRLAGDAATSTGAIDAFRSGLRDRARIPAAALEPGARASPARRLRRKAGASTNGGFARPSLQRTLRAYRRSALDRRRSGGHAPARHRRARPGRHDPAPALRAAARRTRRARDRRRSRAAAQTLAATAPGVLAAYALDGPVARVRRAHSVDVAAGRARRRRSTTSRSPCPTCAPMQRASRSGAIVRDRGHGAERSASPGPARPATRTTPAAACRSRRSRRSSTFRACACSRSSARAKRSRLPTRPGRSASLPRPCATTSTDSPRSSRALDLVISVDTSLAHLAGHWASRCGCCSPSCPIGDGCLARATARGIRRRACSASGRPATGQPSRSASSRRSSANASIGAESSNTRPCAARMRAESESRYARSRQSPRRCAHSRRHRARSARRGPSAPACPCSAGRA